jgi:type VI protein secretion system component VasF
MTTIWNKDEEAAYFYHMDKREARRRRRRRALVSLGLAGAIGMLTWVLYALSMHP